MNAEDERHQETPAIEEAQAMLALIRLGEQLFYRGEGIPVEAVFAELRRKKELGA